MAIEQVVGTWGVDQAAEFLGCTPGTLRVWVSKKRIPHFKVGRLTRFMREDLELYLKARHVDVAPRPTDAMV
jgi:excisionase family DNA binding protein